VIIKKIERPQDKESSKLFNRHGEKLLCVRLHNDLEKMMRSRTAELVVDEAPFHQTTSGQDYSSPPPATPYVGVVVDMQETDIAESLEAMGGFWSAGDRLWYAPEHYVRRLGLRSRIVKRAGHCN
jgi:hypothetical protein